MTIKQILVICLIFISFGFAFGHSVGTDQQYKINAQLKAEYDELKTNYDVLEIQYKRDLESCYTQLGDLQDRYELGGQMKQNERAIELLEELIEELSWVENTDEELRNAKIINKLKKILKEL